MAIRAMCRNGRCFMAVRAMYCNGRCFMAVRAVCRNREPLTDGGTHVTNIIVVLPKIEGCQKHKECSCAQRLFSDGGLQVPAPRRWGLRMLYPAVLLSVAIS